MFEWDRDTSLVDPRPQSSHLLAIYFKQKTAQERQMYLLIIN